MYTTLLNPDADKLSMTDTKGIRNSLDHSGKLHKSTPGNTAMI